ncbi:MAG: DNA adenine methylase [Anaerolineales bacterium]|nr:DNA adenine methylase [Anaerolineales bacterium]
MLISEQQLKLQFIQDCLSNKNDNNKGVAKPFLKWAGGKTQLLEQFSYYFPKELKEGLTNYYYEPFLGSGAVFFYIAQKYQIKKAFLSDINDDLVITFSVVQNNVYELINELSIIKSEYISKNEDERKNYYYKIREQYNVEKVHIKYDKYYEDLIPRAAKLIFLNKTCFNGLYRLNRKGEFNVPFGRYKNPRILDIDNLLNANRILQIADISITDFENIKDKIINDKFFVYLDPPYRPISNTSSFTSYSKYDFSEEDQIRLANFFCTLSKNGNKVMLSNSDPKNENPSDSFFDDLYKGFSIYRVKANRMINCKSNKRGSLTELLIINYKQQPN